MGLRTYKASSKSRFKRSTYRHDRIDYRIVPQSKYKQNPDFSVKIFQRWSITQGLIGASTHGRNRDRAVRIKLNMAIWEGAINPCVVRPGE
jgi:hypothetical protein